jgi:lipopolysaccharide/colanic/teichoic acid biosynthesis glycosyltransferase
MSIVGPRPLPVHIEEKIKRSIKIKRRKVLPGITGLSQINYTGKKRKLVKKIDLDVELVNNYNLYNYFKIIIKTPGILFIRLLKNKTSIIE